MVFNRPLLLMLVGWLVGWLQFALLARLATAPNAFDCNLGHDASYAINSFVCSSSTRSYLSVLLVC